MARDIIAPDTAPGGMQFKRSVNLADKAPSEAALSFCATIARLIASTLPPSSPLPKTGSEIREEIIRGGEAFVSLAALTKYCWRQNIAVVQITTLPGKSKGMDAMAMRVRGRDIIIVTHKAQKQPEAWLSFLIAHELGHIALGHVAENEALADDVDHDGDDIESAANMFAQQVLAGSDFNSLFKRLDFTPTQLKSWAKKCALEARVDPGHVILRYGRECNNYPLAMKAWSGMRTVSASTKINDIALNAIDLSDIGDDSGDMLRSVLALSNA